MGFFDRLTGRKDDDRGPSAETPANAAIATANVVARIAAGREKLAAKDLAGAIAIYEQLLATAGDRADVLVAISGDLGAHGHVAEIIELVAPRYDADRHGPATGLNLLQAYLVTRNADAAQHVLDILFALNRPELEDRLHGFSNAIAEIIHERHQPLDPGAVGVVAEVPKVGLVTLSKPVWFYGLEPLAERILPPKDGRLRRIAFGQLALPGAYPDVAAAMQEAPDDLGRWARALPLWLAESFYFSAGYAPIAAVGIWSRAGIASRPMIFASEWTAENLRQLVETAGDGLDYGFTGALKRQDGEVELVLRVWEIKKLKERKTFSARWTPATMDAELGRLHEQVRMFMEWKPASGGVARAMAQSARGWMDTLAGSLETFLVEKKVLPPESVASLPGAMAAAGELAAASEATSLAYLSLRARAAKLGLDPGAGEVVLFDSPLVSEAHQLLR